MLKLSKKFALPLIAVLIIGTGVGAYFLFRNFQLPRYFVDRYPELLEYCDTEESEGGLKISCKALMLDIKPNVSDGIPSLTSLIIANDEELREYTITEKEEVFAWTNEVLQFKKLKPIIINLQYVKKNPITYSIQGITFEDIPETYIQEIVNRDIEEIMGMDKSSTTILNSFDFCPRPETLPDYVIKKDEYAKYWNENILNEDEYKYTSDPTLEIFDNVFEEIAINQFFLCESSNNRELLNICNNKETRYSTKILKPTSDLEIITPISWAKNLDTFDILLLRKISLIYDNLFLIDGTSEYFNDFDELIQALNYKYSPNESLICGLHKIYVVLSNVDSKYLKSQNYIEELLLQNTEYFTSPLCYDIFTENDYNQLGQYLKQYFLINTNGNYPLQIFTKCTNLKFFIEK